MNTHTERETKERGQIQCDGKTMSVERSKRRRRNRKERRLKKNCSIFAVLRVRIFGLAN